MWWFILQGFGDRLLSEIKKLSPKDVQIKVSINDLYCIYYDHSPQNRLNQALVKIKLAVVRYYCFRCTSVFICNSFRNISKNREPDDVIFVTCHQNLL